CACWKSGRAPRSGGCSTRCSRRCSTSPSATSATCCSRSSRRAATNGLEPPAGLDTFFTRPPFCLALTLLSPAPAPRTSPPALSMSAVQRPVRRELDQVQNLLREAFRTPIPILNQVGGHVLATRGKKFRPTLLLLVNRLRGELEDDAVRCATVVEMVHAA